MTPPLFGRPIEPGEPKYSMDFEEFWEWSTKRGSKLLASKAYRNALQVVYCVDETRSCIWDGMRVWRASEQWQAGIIPHVSTWLNRRGWEEIVPRKPEPKHVHTAMCKDFGFCPERSTL